MIRRLLSQLCVRFQCHVQVERAASLLRNWAPNSSILPSPKRVEVGVVRVVLRSLGEERDDSGQQGNSSRKRDAGGGRVVEVAAVL